MTQRSIENSCGRGKQAGDVGVFAEKPKVRSDPSRFGKGLELGSEVPRARFEAQREAIGLSINDDELLLEDEDDE